MEKALLLDLPDEFIHTCRICQLKPEYILQTFIKEASAVYNLNTETDDASELAFKFIEKLVRHSDWPVGNTERLIYRRQNRILTRYNLEFFNSEPCDKTRVVHNQIFRNWYNDLENSKPEQHRFPLIPLPGLRSIELSGAIKLQIEQGDTEELYMTWPENNPGNTLWSFKNGHLNLLYTGPVAFVPFIIEDDSGAVFESYEYEAAPMLTLHLTYKHLNALSTTDTAQVEGINPVRSDKLRLSAYGRSLIDVDAEVKELDVVIKEDSQLFLYGFADRSRSHLSGAAKLLGNLAVNQADIKMKNDSIAGLDVNDKLTASLHDQALLLYQLNATDQAQISLHGNSKAMSD